MYMLDRMAFQSLRSLNQSPGSLGKDNRILNSGQADP